MIEKRFKVKEKNNIKTIQEIGLNGEVWEEYYNVNSIVDKLNEQHETILMWCKSSKRITELLKEAVKPTYKDNVYLSIDCETKRCKYENTIICNQCDYYSTYFLDCRLMMSDNQYRKAISIGLI